MKTSNTLYSCSLASDVIDPRHVNKGSRSRVSAGGALFRSGCASLGLIACVVIAVLGAAGFPRFIVVVLVGSSALLI
jgi:hypothetical protein